MTRRLLGFGGLLIGLAAFARADILPQISTATFVELEAPVILSTAVPQEAPVRVRLPDVVATRDEWRGVQCAVTQPREALFRHADKWAAFWRKGMAPFSPRLKEVPAIDFAKDMVVAVFLGERPTPHYQVEITSVRRERQADGEALVIRYREIDAMVGVFNPPFTVQPYHLKRVPRYDGPIRFKRIR